MADPLRDPLIAVSLLLVLANGLLLLACWRQPAVATVHAPSRTT